MELLKYDSSHAQATAMPRHTCGRRWHGASTATSQMVRQVPCRPWLVATCRPSTGHLFGICVVGGIPSLTEASYVNYTDGESGDIDDAMHEKMVEAPSKMASFLRLSSSAGSLTPRAAEEKSGADGSALVPPAP